MSEQSTEIIRVPDEVQLGQIRLAPEEVIERASQIAKPLKEMIIERGLVSLINGRDYVQVEGWNTLGAMLGIAPRTVSVSEIQEGVFEATVELIRVSDGMVIGRGIGECGAMDELNRRGFPVWGDRPRFAKKSMAQTRATGKAYRQLLSWIVKLVGYEPTPAEEMIEGEFMTVEGAQDGKIAQKTAKPGAQPASGSAATNSGTIPKPLEPSAVKAFCWKIIESDKGGDGGTDQLPAIINTIAGALAAADPDPEIAAEGVFQYLFDIPVLQATYVHVNALWRWLGIQVGSDGHLSIGRESAIEEIGAIYQAAQA